ncbi:unnamed protein product (macronuclear) [Paramecium tetraurelia]|uniref:Uncharacterized protein n=1 Tax=Paramecium tetraurelia TaxID=5888 RepID=A0E422_PARTE|nr:uncharacterized protein GSPATT00023212001 [Paramecium tetraurelia]CAK90039.1 unnamed protein product [Paramecium tetraurelia]|eukprot:XP_001457436.1 hypothetical protein (macronuclear) [Paramecium tetraurelia strain d4-2]
MTYIVDDNNTVQEYKQKSDLLNLIYNLKSHLRENPCNKVKLFIVQKERKIGDMDDSDLDLHKKCKKQLKDLTEKLTKRDQLIQDQTSSYMKEIQNLTEQIYRLNHAQLNNENILIDRNLIKDQATLDIINKNLEKVSHNYENKIKHLNIIIEAQKRELVMTKQALKDFKQKHEHHQSAEYLVRKIAQLEKDPYKIWKYFQENHGNSFILSVFKHQKQGYGINYKEIDQILSQSKIIERELQIYQQLIETSLTLFMEKLTQDQKKIKETYSQKETELTSQIALQHKIQNDLETNYQKIISFLLTQNKNSLLHAAILVWRNQTQISKSITANPKQASSISDFLQSMQKLKVNYENLEYSSIYHNQFIQLQSKITWLQKLLLNYQQSIQKQQFSKDLLENQLKLLQQKVAVNNQNEKQNESDKKKQNQPNFEFEKEMEVKQKQQDLEQNLHHQFVQEARNSDQYTQTEEYFVPQYKQFLTPPKVIMQNELIQNQLENNIKGQSEVQIFDIEQPDVKKQTKTSIRQSYKQFESCKPKTPCNKTYSAFNTSLESNIIELKPKIVSDQKEYNVIRRKSECKTEVKPVPFQTPSKRYQKVDLLKQVELLSQLQLQLKECGTPQEKNQMSSSQRQERGFRTSVRRKPNLSITFEQFHNEMNVDPLEMFSSTQRQNKIKRLSTKDCEYLVL